jgi:hypothetical protein
LAYLNGQKVATLTRGRPGVEFGGDDGSAGRGIETFRDQLDEHISALQAATVNVLKIGASTAANNGNF